MAFEIIGRVIEILPVNQVSDKFRKREFIIEKKESGGSCGFRGLYQIPAGSG